jgi:citrate synthase
MHRLSNISECLRREEVARVADSLQVVDNRTKKTYHISLTEAKDCYFLKTKDLAGIVSRQEVPLRLYDPGYMHTICNRSSISYIDGQRGVLEYRGYPIEQLADRSSFVEVAFLLIYGELPGAEQLASFS